MVRFGAAACALALAAVGASASMADDEEFFSGIVIFGDSLSDTGNGPDQLDIAGPFPTPPYFDSRFSDGLIYADLLPALLGLEGASSANYALGGAFTGQRAIPGIPTADGTAGNIGFTDPAGLGLLIGAGANLDAYENSDVLSQVGQFGATGPDLGDNSLAVVFAGSNNYFFSGGGIAAQVGAGLIDPTTPEGSDAITAIALADINSAIADLATSVGTLDALGVSEIAVVNLPDLGQTVLGQGSDPTLFSTFSSFHNQFLTSALVELGQATDANVTLVDFATLFDDAIANPTKYGLTNVTDSCLSVDPTGQNCDGFLFFDDVHPTQSVAASTAAFFADTLTAPRTITPQGEVIAQSALDFQRGVISEFAQARPTSGHVVMADVSYRDVERDQTSSAYGYDTEATSYSLGAVFAMSPEARVGMAVGYVDGDTDMGGVGGFTTQGFRAAAFASAEFGRLEGVVSGAFYGDDIGSISRNTGVAGQVTQGGTNANSVSAMLEARYRLGDETIAFGPLGRITYVDVNVNGYRERGATGLDQIVFDRDLNPMTGDFGVFAEGSAGLDWALEAAFVEQLSDESQVVDTALVTQSAVVRSLTSNGEIDGAARFTGRLGGTINGVDLSIAGEALTSEDGGDAYALRASLGKAF